MLFCKILISDKHDKKAEQEKKIAAEKAKDQVPPDFIS